MYTGEVGLSGELRSVHQLAKRINEAEKIGFKKIVIPKTSEKIDAKKITVSSLTDLSQAVKDLI